MQLQRLNKPAFQPNVYLLLPFKKPCAAACGWRQWRSGACRPAAGSGGARRRPLCTSHGGWRARAQAGGRKECRMGRRAGEGELLKSGGGGGGGGEGRISKIFFHHLLLLLPLPPCSYSTSTTFFFFLHLLLPPLRIVFSPVTRRLSNHFYLLCYLHSSHTIQSPGPVAQSFPGCSLQRCCSRHQSTFLPPSVKVHY